MLLAVLFSNSNRRHPCWQFPSCQRCPGLMRAFLFFHRRFTYSLALCLIHRKGRSFPFLMPMASIFGFSYLAVMQKLLIIPCLIGPDFMGQWALDCPKVHLLIQKRLFKNAQRLRERPYNSRKDSFIKLWQWPIKKGKNRGDYDYCRYIGHN